LMSQATNVLRQHVVGENNRWNLEENIKLLKWFTEKDNNPLDDTLEDFCGIDDLVSRQDYGDLNINDYEFEPNMLLRFLNVVEDRVSGPMVRAYYDGAFDYCMNRPKQLKYNISLDGYEADTDGISGDMFGSNQDKQGVATEVEFEKTDYNDFNYDMKRESKLMDKSAMAAATDSLKDRKDDDKDKKENKEEGDENEDGEEEKKYKKIKFKCFQYGFPRC